MSRRIEIVDGVSPHRGGRRQNSVFPDAYGRAMLCVDCGKAIGPFDHCQKCGGLPHVLPAPQDLEASARVKAHALTCSPCLMAWLRDTMEFELLATALECMVRDLPKSSPLDRAVSAARRLVKAGV